MIKRTFLWGHSHAKSLWADSLYRNSFWLMAGQFLNAGLGFVYWFIATRYYSATQIGLATTYFSAVALISGFATLGFGTTLIRYLPSSENKEKKINTSLTLVSLASIVLGAMYLLGLPIWTDKLLFVTSSLHLILLAIMYFPLNTINNITDSIFTAFKSTHWVFISNFIQSLVKLIVVLALISLGVWGILGSYFFAITTASMVCLWVIKSRFKIKLKFEIDYEAIQKVKKFALGSHVLSLVGGLPVLVMPILITNLMTPAQTAYFYIPNMLVGLLTIIPSMMSKSYLSESSHITTDLSFKKPMFVAYSILTPIALIMAYFGRMILGIFGSGYAKDGYWFLNISLLAILVSIPTYFITSKLLVHKKVLLLTKVSIFGSGVYLASAAIFARLGIVGIAVGSLVGQGATLIVCLVILINFLEDGSVSNKIEGNSE